MSDRPSIGSSIACCEWARSARSRALESHRSHRGPTHAGWFYQKHLAGGGVLLDLGIYQLSAVAALFGPAVSMTAFCTRQADTRIMDDGAVVSPDVEDSVLISLLLENKITVSVNANWNGCLSHHQTRTRVVVVGRAGILHFGVADGAVYVFRPDGNYEAIPAGAKEAMFDGHACRSLHPEQLDTPPSTIGDFVARIKARDTCTRSLDMQIHVLEIITKAYEAAASGQVIAIEQRFDRARQ